MRIDILTLFPEMFVGPFDASIVKRAKEKGHLQILFWNIRDFARDRHRTVDDAPYGGGAGLVMKPEPLFSAVDAAIGEGLKSGATNCRVVLLAPQGSTLRQEKVRELAGADQLIILCGHYEGIDDRVRQAVVTDEVSIGDYVLTGGEVAAMVVVDAVSRLLPGVLGDAASAEEESFEEGLLEYPHYTRPEEFRGMRVPSVLIQGDHELVGRWRRRESLRRTLLHRPDLLGRAALDRNDYKLLREILVELAEKGRDGQDSGPIVFS